MSILVMTAIRFLGAGLPLMVGGIVDGNLIQ